MLKARPGVSAHYLREFRGGARVAAGVGACLVLDCIGRCVRHLPRFPRIAPLGGLVTLRAEEVGAPPRLALVAPTRRPDTHSPAVELRLRLPRRLAAPR